MVAVGWRKEQSRVRWWRPPRIAGAAIALAALTAAIAPAQTGAAQPPPEEGSVQIPAPVAVNLNITPKRLILDRGSRSGTVYIFNQGNAPATFDISLVERVMLPSGEIKTAAEAREDPQTRAIAERLVSAQPMLVATPRRVTLAPGRGQTIRVRAMQPATGSAEYRTHLTVTTMPPRDAGVTPEQARSEASGQISFRINSVFGLSIPIIIRTAAADARGAIENARLGSADVSPDGVAPPVRTPVASFELHRLGPSSLYGNVEIKAVRGRNRETLGLARGVGVYPEIERRLIQIPLRRPLQPGEQLEITFIDDDSSPGRVIARSSLTGS